MMHEENANRGGRAAHIEYVENRWQFEPGNGTRYCIIAVRLPGYTCCGTLGLVEDGWLVVDGLGRAALLPPGGFLHHSYVAEKFGLGPDGQDAGHLVTLINYVLGHPAPEEGQGHG